MKSRKTSRGIRKRRRRRVRMERVRLIIPCISCNLLHRIEGLKPGRKEILFWDILKIHPFRWLDIQFCLAVWMSQVWSTTADLRIVQQYLMDYLGNQGFQAWDQRKAFKDRSKKLKDPDKNEKDSQAIRYRWKTSNVKRCPTKLSWDALRILQQPRLFHKNSTTSANDNEMEGATSITTPAWVCSWHQICQVGAWCSLRFPSNLTKKAPFSTNSD